MCGDCGQHACDFHFNQLNEEVCPDRERIHGMTLCGPCHQDHPDGDPCLALSDSENDCQCRCDSGMGNIEGKTAAEINASLEERERAPTGRLKPISPLSHQPIRPLAHSPTSAYPHEATKPLAHLPSSAYPHEATKPPAHQRISA